MSNHHLGQTELGGYVLKVLMSKYSKTESVNLKNAVHTAGHWASTLKIYTAAGITNKGVGEPVMIATGQLLLAEDAQKRFTSLPAGTHRVRIAHAGLTRLICHTVILITPDVASLSVVSTEYKKIRANPQKYHIGAFYITGEPRLTYDESGILNTLGRITSFVQRLMSKSTLAKSPHAAFPESYEDYDEHFVTQLTAYGVNSNKRAKAGEALVDDVVRLTTGNAYRILAESMGLTVSERIIAMSDKKWQRTISGERTTIEDVTAEATTADLDVEQEAGPSEVIVEAVIEEEEDEEVTPKARKRSRCARKD